MIVRVLGSGSKGNAVLLEAGGTRVLIDAGFSPRGMQKRLEVMEVTPDSIEAVIITHEHTDHVGGVAACAKRWGWRVLASAGTRTGSASLARASVETVSTSARFTIGQLDLTTVGTSHDANEPMAVFATSRETGARTGIVYDLGILTEALMRALRGVDILMIEANHDVAMLRNGPYPPSLRRRIASRYGHLSNDDAAAAARRCAHRNLSHVVLAHLSENNNRPDIATEAVRAALEGTDFTGDVTAASQGRVTGPFTPKGMPYRGAAQLQLAI
ncbi:MAG TPA: MBL fold metallo-hydrolase [Gemmatimonadaceae bacterium]